MTRLLILALLASAAIAQEAYNPLPLQRADGGMCFADETCAEPWREFASSDDTGWYCAVRQRFCATEYRGLSCMCFTGERPPGWVPTGAAIDYHAEIVEHTIDVCYLDGIRRQGTPAEDERALLDIMKALNAELVDVAVRSLMPVVAGEDWEVRQFAYEFAAEACIEGMSAADDAR